MSFSYFHIAPSLGRIILRIRAGKSFHMWREPTLAARFSDFGTRNGACMVREESIAFPGIRLFTKTCVQNLGLDKDFVIHSAEP